MSDSFFDLDNSGPCGADMSFLEEEDDTDYDALNYETFGEDVPSSDWEEVHERLASELENRTLDDENNELSERVASSILDDESEELSPVKAAKPPTSGIDSGAWWSENGQRPGGPSTLNKAQGSIVDSWWDPNRTQNSFRNRMAQFGHTEPPITVVSGKIQTVEEIEAQIRKEAEAKIRTSPSGASMEDLRMGRPDPMMNGHYSRNRPSGSGGGMMIQRGAMGGSRGMGGNRGMGGSRSMGGSQGMGGNQGMGGRFIRGRHEALVPERFHHHNFLHNAPFKDGMPMPMRPVLGLPGPPRHQGMMFPRHPQMMMRHTSPHFYPNQQQHQQKSYRPRAPVPQPTTSPLGRDEYAGLMNNYEKNFIASIQMAQLNSSQPYQDDYYYLMHSHRQQGNCSRKITNHNIKNREVTPQRPLPTYTPMQFENSLGKLQIGSVTAPRKIIDMDLVENVENNAKITDRKSKQVLILIEEMFVFLFQMEDVFNPLNLPFNTGVNRNKINMVELQDKLVNIMLAEHKLVQIMSIRKGKRLVLRILPLLFTPGPLIHQLLVDLVPITRKDTEQLLLSFLPSIRTYLATVPLSTLVLFTKNYDTTFFLSNKFTISVMANIVERAEAVIADAEPEVVDQWLSTLVRLLTATEKDWADSERPVVAVDREVLTRHLSRVKDRASEQQISDLTRALSNIYQPAMPANTAAQPPPTTTYGN